MRRADTLGDSDAEVSMMLDRARTGEALNSHDLLVALRTQERQELLNLLSQASIPDRERGMLFLRDLPSHYYEAMETIRHYELVEEGDVPPPSHEKALDALIDHLRLNPHHVEVIGQMERPILQLIPVYEPEGTGFQRMVNAYNAHIPQRLRESLGHWQVPTYIREVLQNRWELNSGTPGKIVGWEVVVVEGGKVLPQRSNPYAGQSLEDQLTRTREDAERQDLQLCDKKRYIFLQMREIQQAALDAPLEELGIDPRHKTIIEDSTREIGSYVPHGLWYVDQVRFNAYIADAQRGDARFRFAVVVKKIL